MAGLIRVLSTSTVRPESGDRHGDVNRRIELTTSDLQYLPINYIQRGLLFHKPSESPRENLKAALSQALDRLYPLAGRLVATEHHGDVKTVSFHVICSGAGAMFVHAEADASITAADILDPLVARTEIIECLFPLTGIFNYQAAGSDLPLLAVKVTEFADGVFVGLVVNHAVADGTTFWDFFNVWSELSRGDSAAVSRRGGFVFARECSESPVRIAFKPPVRIAPPVPLCQRVFRFSKDKIAELKAKANAENPGPDREISSLQALLAHLWVCITRARAPSDDEAVCLMVAVGMRSRLLPPLPRYYVGNAIACTVATCTVGELLGHGTGRAARRINEAIAGIETREFLENYAERLKSLFDFSNLPRNLLAVAGSPRFDMYGNDFGWGRPIGPRSGLPGDVDGKLIVSPGSEEGRVDFEASLSPETFQALAGDPEFTQYCS